MAITLALGQAAEVTCELKDITYKWTPTDLISWHLQRHRGSLWLGEGEGRLSEGEYKGDKRVGMGVG